MMSGSPFFSILLPTKNRSHLVGFAISSVLNQDYHDFEIIVVDNDDSDVTEKAISNLVSSDSRIRYFKTGGLNMSENWEFALSKAEGKYITVLEDKQAYYPYALSSMYKEISQKSIEVVVWGWDFYDHNHARLRYSDRNNHEVLYTPDKILETYVHNPAAAWKVLPRMINSVVSIGLIRRVKAQNGGKRLFSEMAPDLCAGFQLLAICDAVCVMNKSLGALGYMHLSNATQVMKKKAVNYYGKERINEIAVDHVPIKENRLIHNTVYNDYLRIRQRMGGRLIDYKMSNKVYAKLCARDLAMNLVNVGFHKSAAASILDYAKENGVSSTILLASFLREYGRRLVMKGSIRYLVHKKSLRAENILEAVNMVGAK